MEIYPSIDTKIVSTPIYAFDKLDGSNIRAQWSRKNGFERFGTRRRLLDRSDLLLGEACDLIMESHAEELDRIFRKQRYEKATAFFEFYGENSFAGLHENEPHQVSLLEVHQYKKGFVPPRDFVKYFYDKVPCAELLYVGNPNQPFIDSVKNSTLEGMTFEGVICKGGKDARNRQIMFKVKSQAWLDRLKGHCGDDLNWFEKLV